MADPTKLACWFDAHAAALVLYARQWLAGQDRARAAAAEDVVQEAFVKLMAQRREPDNVKAWLYTTVRNAAISESRSAARRRTRETRAATPPSAEWFARDPADLLDAQAVRDAIEHLPPPQREVVVLRVWSGMTLAEVSQITGMPVTTCFEEYRRALGAIRRTMENTCDAKTK